jgi:hypothetical protein
MGISLLLIYSFVPFASFSKGFSHLGQAMGYLDWHGTIVPHATSWWMWFKNSIPFHSQKVIQLKVSSFFLRLNASFWLGQRKRTPTWLYSERNTHEGGPSDQPSRSSCSRRRLWNWVSSRRLPPPPTAAVAVALVSPAPTPPLPPPPIRPETQG